jgi:acyl-CoA thioesterase I
MSKTHEKTILVIGDSLSKGVSLNEEKKRYCFLKHSFVNNLSDTLCAKIINTAKFGTTIKHGASKLEENLLKHTPEIVLIEYGGNDCDFNWDEIAINPHSEHLPNTPLKEYEAHLKTMIRKIRSYGAKPVVMTLPPLNAVDYFRWFTKGSKEKGDSILKWLEDVSKIYWWHERYSVAVSSVANACNVPLIDARRYFLKTPDFRKYVCSDGIHPNEKGHKLITSSILDCLTKIPRVLILFNSLRLRKAALFYFIKAAFFYKIYFFLEHII